MVPVLVPRVRHHVRKRLQQRGHCEPKRPVHHLGNFRLLHKVSHEGVLLAVLQLDGAGLADGDEFENDEDDEETLQVEVVPAAELEELQIYVMRGVHTACISFFL